ncbi:hypothetical protein C6W24_04720 [Bacillus atrophaeus]|nr:hypothetical protein C6W24_04720 [Bacillus atrophaeus]
MYRYSRKLSKIATSCSSSSPTFVSFTFFHSSSLSTNRFTVKTSVPVLRTSAKANRILSKISPDTHVIALPIEGKMKTSEELADAMDKLATYGKRKVFFVIGGSLGLSHAVMKRADDKLLFSKMTFPHQVMRLILVEQIYRAFRINRGSLKRRGNLAEGNLCSWFSNAYKFT